MTSPTLLSIVIFTAQVAGFLTAVKAIMETRTAQGAIAWAVSLIALPWVAVPAYWIFGRTKFAGYVTARRAEVLKTSYPSRRIRSSRVKSAACKLPPQLHPRLAYFVL